jgi:hypothetical protein
VFALHSDELAAERGNAHHVSSDTVVRVPVHC